jgi:hypothetical protein
MKRSLISLVVLSLPFTACIKHTEYCEEYNDPSCPNYIPPVPITECPCGAPNEQGFCPAPTKAPGGETAVALGKDAGADHPKAFVSPDAGAPLTPSTLPILPKPDAGVVVEAGSAIEVAKDTLPCNEAGGCGKPVVPMCTWSFQCGSGGRCADGECQRPCTTGTSCGTGYACQADFCQPSSTSGGQCLYSSDCTSGSQCINGFCHAGCKAEGDCPNRADACVNNVCRSDGRPTPQCRSNQDCPAGRECVNAACRTPCESDLNCGVACSGTICKDGYCVGAQEVSPQCTHDSSCGAGKSCIDAICL